MSETPCQVCSAVIADGATFCTRCAHTLDAELADVVAARGLAYDLALAAAKQTRMGGGGVARRTLREPLLAGPLCRACSHPTCVAIRDRYTPGVLAANALPYDRGASKAAATLRTVLSSWARLVVAETGDTVPRDDLTGVAAFLRRRGGWLRHHPAGAEAWDQIVGAVRDARRATDRPADRLYAGPCDCGDDLYARLDAEYVACWNVVHGSDGVSWPVEARRRWLLRSAADLLLTATEISRALTRYQQPVTQSSLRGYVYRKRLVARGERREGGRMVMLYRLGDVLDILTQAEEKASA